ncbi:MAG TPA: acyl-CoA desaturase [Pilimelia sp.]|nr:acyl-CoA desaturase [Pilimelia sp.]
MSTSEAEIAAIRPYPQPPVGLSEPPVGSLYALLLRQIKAAGLLERCTGYYVRRIAVTTALLAAGWTAFILVGDSWWQLAVAVFLAFVFTQLGFVGHEAGHRQISASRRPNDVIGLLYGDLAIGLSFGWWVDKHNRHHAHPNQEGKDPDIEIGALAFTEGQVRSRGPVARLVYRYQAYLFFPLLLLEGVNLHVASIRALAARRAVRHRIWEAALFAVHVVGYLGVVFWVLPPVKAIVFIAVQQGLFGLYLGCSFAPNHKGMAILAADDHSDFLRRQVLTSRNVRGSGLVDYALGGLNYQIEHHLFPSMPRPNLHRAQPIVREFCRQHGLPYCETSLVDSYAQALRHLNTVGRASRATPT